MSQCKECGATLPENSTVCLQCGARNAISRAESEDMPRTELDFLKPALAGGAILSVMTSLFALISGAINRPILQATCCLWLVGGAGIAVRMLDKQRPGTLTYGDGALVGLFSGIVSAILSTVLGIPLRYLQAEQLARASEQIQQSPMVPAVKNFLLQMLAPGINLTALLFGLVTGLIVNSLLMTGLGAVMVAILNRKKTD